MRTKHLLAVSIGLWLAGCDDEGANISGVPGYNIRSVRVSPAIDTLYVPDTIRSTDRATFAASAEGKSGAPLASLTFAWQSSDTTIATVDAAGVVTPRTYGTVDILASATRIGRATLVILPLPSVLTISPTLDSIYVDEPIVALRDSLRLKAESRDAAGVPVTGIAYTWRSSAPGIASVDAAGLVRAAGLGTATISVETTAGTATSTVRVVPVVASLQASAPVTEVLALDTVQLAAVAHGYDGATMARTFAWTSSNSTVATVDAAGRVIVHATGSSSITARTAFRTATVNLTSHPRVLLAVEAGADFTCGYASLGRGYCWGLDTEGQTGARPDSTCYSGPLAPEADCTLLPKRVQNADLRFTAVSAGGEFACGVEADQRLYCWGDNRWGQLGNGRIASASTPSLATVKSERFTTVSAGDEHACALNLAGVAYCWGNDDVGQLGDRRRIHSTTPIPVADTTLRFLAIAAGGRHTCAIAEGGAAFCWGDGALGQLGNGGTGVVDTPTPVTGGGTYVAISAGDSHTCAVEASGALFCWGANQHAQLGLGTSGGTRLDPTLVPGSGGFTAVSAGGSHTCGIAAGMAVCWGRSDWGQVGDGDLSTHTVSAPVQVAGGFAASAITAGGSHSCAIASGTGLTWCWGSNRWGTLGNEYQAAYRATPQLVARPR